MYEEGRISTAVGIDKDKNSQSAVKWALEKLRLKDNHILLAHVKVQQGFDSRMCFISFNFIYLLGKIFGIRCKSNSEMGEIFKYD